MYLQQQEKVIQSKYGHYGDPQVFGAVGVEWAAIEFGCHCMVNLEAVLKR